MYRVAHLLLKIFRWRMEGSVPDLAKFVMIAAPHTSNWDLPITLTLAFTFKLKIFWMGKDAMFRWPFGAMFRWLGGIPIDRSQRKNMVEQTIDVFRRNEEMVIVIPPEGTRSKVRYWKTGFYHVANGAGVPIVLGFLDYRRKAGGFGPVLVPTGDIEADMGTIRAFYANIVGKYLDKSGQASVVDRDR